MKHFFTLISSYLLLGLWCLQGQIVADSIAHNLELVQSNKVKAVRTGLDVSFKEIQQQTAWKTYDASFTTPPEKALWLSFEMENSSGDTIHNYLYSLNHYTTVYQEWGQGFKKMKNGYFVPLPQRANASENFFTKLTFLPFQKSQLYIRLAVKKVHSKITAPAIFSENSYWEFALSNYKEQAYSIGFIYFYIISLFTILIFALVFWIRLRDNLYLHYLGYLVFQLVYGFLALRGTLAPVGNFFNYFPKLADDLMEPVQFAFIGFYVFFILKLLRVKNYDQLLASILKYLGLACFGYAIAQFLFTQLFYDGEVSQQVFTWVRLIILPLNFVLIFWIIYKVKHPLLVYFIVGQTFFFIGALLASYIGYFSQGSMFNFKEAANIVFQIGLLAEVYCFSLALGKNMFLLQKEKEEVNAGFIAQLQENQQLQKNMNRELDKKVNEKTEELIQLYSEIEQEKQQKIEDDFMKKIQETEMIVLRAQMNPHFIFNSMTAIKNLIMTGRNDAAMTYLDDFSSLLRDILENSNREKITVEEEFEFIKLYLSLEKSRMGPELNYSLQVSSKEELSQYHIPPLLLQPLVENAIWHGLHPSLKAEKKLSIVFDTSTRLKITIEDNGIGRAASDKREKVHKSMGTKIVKDRLALYNHLREETIHFKITDLEEDGIVLGTRITLTY
ncbi:histidine kinase [Marixanthomonas spongiae]|uniref:Histidine kinase n=1 Tax=Marixanthomonas spongiae TaxID=2174845 RepID=A0A2U0HYK3_9FLAO|nr:histidine kinase [Marixanthomonas spongiae]PVW13918.1 histidine kinase [Marixanthomonas spongiae]